MGRKFRQSSFRALGLGLLALVILPAVNNPTPSLATSLAWQSIDAPESTWIVVNKLRPLNPIKYVPKDLVAPKFGTLNANPYGRKLRKEASTAAYRLAMAMYAEGKGSLIEHQTGWAMDVSARDQGCQIRVCFGQTKAGSWLAKNAYKYGFIIRYPNNATPTTGYQYEPWHLRYVGKGLAMVMHDDRVVTLEKFFNLPSAPNY